MSGGWGDGGWGFTEDDRVTSIVALEDAVNPFFNCLCAPVNQVQAFRCMFDIEHSTSSEGILSIVATFTNKGRQPLLNFMARVAVPRYH